MPGTLTQIRHWFRFYKVPDGKPVNSFAFDGEFLDAERAVYIVEKHHKQYLSLWEAGVEVADFWTPTEKPTPVPAVPLNQIN